MRKKSEKIESIEMKEDIKQVATTVFKYKNKVLRKRNTNKAVYVNNSEMLQELIIYSEQKIITNKLGEMFMKIAKRFTNMYSFSNYIFRDELISSAVYRMIEYIDKFDVKRKNPNPFCYFTQIAYNQILTVIRKEKQQLYIKNTCRDNIWDELCSEEKIQVVDMFIDKDEFCTDQELIPENI